MSIKKVTSHPRHEVLFGNCLEILPSLAEGVDLTFLDPPFNQKKDYSSYDDNLPESEYWALISEVCQKVFEKTNDGGAIYLMHREKNTEQILQVLRKTGWEFQNLIVWKKLTSAVPSPFRFGKSFQVIVYATKGNRPRVFNRLRIEPPLLKNQKYERENGVFVTDIWDDIRELTSGYFAGDEAIRKLDGERFHKQQSPIALLLRIILSSTKVGDTILDAFAGTGTTAVVAQQLKRNSICIEIDKENIACIQNRLSEIRKSDSIEKYFESYKCTENLNEFWGNADLMQTKTVAQTLFAI
ncbi:MAG: site-specific DNA-methyltransferase [Pyrinomonadaceae bacterium]|nr:site-specific DNA-methyltransferase [Pyrinomonadaceae bacterium]